MDDWQAQDVEWDSKRLRASYTTSSRGLSSKTNDCDKEGTRKRGGPARCQVCDLDLAGLKTYYQKYSICQEHSQPQVQVIDGVEVQWCQLCRKFEATSLFDAGRRSCSKSLGVHNKRRRMSRLHGQYPGQAASPSQPSRTAEERTASGSCSDGRADPSHARAAPPDAEAAAAAPADPAPAGAWTARLALPSLDDLLAGYAAQPTPHDRAAWAGIGQGGAGRGMGAAQAGAHPSFFPTTAPPEDGMQVPLATLLNTATSRGAEGGLHRLPRFTYGSEGDQLLRISLKLFNTTPDMLHHDVRSSLASILEVTSSAIEGCIRPGCLHLVVNAWLPTDLHAGYDDPGAVRSFCERLIAQNKFRKGTRHTFQAQILGSSVLATPEKLVTFLHVDAVITAQLRSITPLAITTTDPEAEFSVTARPALAAFSRLLLARHNGMFLEVEGLEPQEGGSDGHAAVAIKVSAPRQPISRFGRWLGRAPRRFQPGVIEVEEQSGRFTSNALPVVVASSAPVVAELRQLEHDPAGLASLTGFLNDVGRVLGAIADGLPTLDDADLLGSLASTAQRLCAYATWRGWPALLQDLTPALTAGSASAAEAVAGVESSLNGLSVLHVAVGSMSPGVFIAWEEWARKHELSLPVTSTFGPDQLTPVHLACMCPGTPMIKTLLRLKRADVAQVWHSKSAAKGASIAALSSEYISKHDLARLGLDRRAGDVLDVNPHAARDCFCAIALAVCSFVWVLFN